MSGIQFEPWDVNLRDFDAEWQKTFGINSRFCVVLMTKTKAELREGWLAEPEAHMELLEVLSNHSNAAEALGKLCEAAVARLLVAAHEAFEVPFENDDEGGK